MKYVQHYHTPPPLPHDTEISSLSLLSACIESYCIQYESVKWLCEMTVSNCV